MLDIDLREREGPVREVRVVVPQTGDDEPTTGVDDLGLHVATRNRDCRGGADELDIGNLASIVNMNVDDAANQPSFTGNTGVGNRLRHGSSLA